ncbi:MAG TPA: glycosyltransferase family 4 protein [Candidatus Binatia bacterium]|nr:glycosyltransferase family 4 protein [Candidatus Binatia bacterium]
MRIGLVCRPFSFHGGVETATAGLVAELARQGDRVELITWSGSSSVPGVRVRVLATARGPSVVRLLSFALAARRAARLGAYDVVQSHERVFVQDVYRAGEGTHRGYLAAMRRPARGVFDAVVLRLERRIFQLQAARHVVAISRQGEEEIRRLYSTPADRVTVVYNGVNLERFHPDRAAAVRDAARAETGLPREAGVVLFVGSGYARKGLGSLVEAFAGLGDARARLVVAGKGDVRPFRAAGERLGLGDRAVWLGPRPDVERLYAAADVLAHPAVYEPFGNVVLEALASGLPVLTSASAGASELVRPGVNGLVVRRVDGPELRQALQDLRDGDARRLRSRARESAEPFTYAAQVAALRAVYGHLPPPASGDPRSANGAFH